VKAGAITESEAALLKRVRDASFEFISVDDFDPKELRAAVVRDEPTGKGLADAA
jgi:acyl-CoA dehydrogenase